MHGAALLIIDMLNDLVFDGGEQLLPKAEAAGRIHQAWTPSSLSALASRGVTCG